MAERSTGRRTIFAHRREGPWQPPKVEFHDFGGRTLSGRTALPGSSSVRAQVRRVGLARRRLQGDPRMSPGDRQGIEKPEYNALDQRFLRRHNVTKFKSNPFFR
jgi:hypothetical protein